jgi:hypothetical protein
LQLVNRQMTGEIGLPRRGESRPSKHIRSRARPEAL